MSSRAGPAAPTARHSAAALQASAVAAHNAGDLQAAALLYQQVISAVPDHADAMHGLARLSLQSGQAHTALDLAVAALQRRPKNAAFHDTHGMALRALGRLAEAEQALRTAIRLAPKSFGPHYNLGNALLAQGKLAEAEQAFRQAIRIGPGFYGVHNNLGHALRQLGRTADAAAAFRAASRAAPGAVEIRVSLADALEALERWDEAEAEWATAMRLNPSDTAIMARRARVLRILRRHDGALPVYQTLARLQPHDLDAATELAGAYQRLGRYDDALAIARRLADAHPHDPRALCTLGGTLREAGQAIASIATLEHGLTLAPGDSRLRYHLAHSYLLAGRLAEGFAAFEARFAILGIDRPGSAPDWDGQAFSGTVLVYDEQGLGDVLQFLRFVPLAARRARIVLRVQPPLRRLAERLPGVAAVVAGDEALPPHDRRCAVCSLPLLLRMAAGPLPSEPYLTADPTLVAAWQAVLAAPPVFRVGLAWSGRPGLEFDTLRSVPLDEFAALASIPGVQFVSLEKDHPARDLAPGVPVLDVRDRLADMMDTAALITALDLVIAVDSSRIHLAGGLGKPAWLLNRHAPDWRWLLGREDSDWYPSVRQFRQPGPHDWTSVMARVRAALLETLRLRALSG